MQNAPLKYRLTVSYKPSIRFSYDPVITPLGVYTRELKTYVHTNTCTQMFIAVLFKVAKTWKQLRFSFVGEWVDKAWYIQTMGYYSVLKRNELSNPEKT